MSNLLVERARDQVDRLTRAYNATWRENPTAGGFRVVDRALDKLEEAEAELRVAEKAARPWL